MKIITYNVNGLRSALKKDFLIWLKAADPDVLCLQEIKTLPEQIDFALFAELGYTGYWHSAAKKGYSGVAIFTKQTPKNVQIGCGIDCYDQEGRVIRADFDNFSLMNVYMPSGSSGEHRQAFKMKWLDDFFAYIQELKKTHPALVICGDFNICHKPIDIHNPKANKNSSGFLPEEREWMTNFFNLGFIDAFRHFNQEPCNYTWWSYRISARTRNLGWRIDYHVVSEGIASSLKRALILSEAKHSDHCPVLLEIL